MRLEAAGVPHGRADAIEPGALVGGLRRGERRAGQLLGIEPVIHLLRRVAADRQRAGQRLGLELLPKPDMYFTAICTPALCLSWPSPYSLE